jgi:hypothetical protein
VPLRPLGYEGARSRLTGSHPYSHVPCDQPPATPPSQRLHSVPPRGVTARSQIWSPGNHRNCHRAASSLLLACLGHLLPGAVWLSPTKRVAREPPAGGRNDVQGATLGLWACLGA